jgi:hypothetical protein
MFQGATAYTGDGICKWRLNTTTKPPIERMFTGSLVTSTLNDKLIWSAWQFNYAYTDEELLDAGLTSNQDVVSLSYSIQKYTLELGKVVNLTAMTKEVLAGPMYSYEITPDLTEQTGLILNTVNGTISGIAEKLISNAEYTITLTDTDEIKWAITQITITIVKGVSSSNAPSSNTGIATVTTF